MKLTFPTRKAAEIAAEQGTTFQGTQLILSWFTAEAAAAHQQKEQQQQQHEMVSLMIADFAFQSILIIMPCLVSPGNNFLREWYGSLPLRS